MLPSYAIVGPTLSTKGRNLLQAYGNVPAAADGWLARRFFVVVFIVVVLVVVVLLLP